MEKPIFKWVEHDKFIELCNDEIHDMDQIAEILGYSVVACYGYRKNHNVKYNSPHITHNSEMREQAKAKALELYREGRSCVEVAKIMEMSESAIGRYVKRAGEQRPMKRLTEERIKEIIEDLKEKVSTQEIAEKVGFSITTVATVQRENLHIPEIAEAKEWRKKHANSKGRSKNNEQKRVVQ